MRSEVAAGLLRFSFSPISPLAALLISFILGAVSVVGYAPYYMYPLPVVTVAGLFYLWSQARTPRGAALTGFAFGLGLLLVGASWVYVSLHDFGSMPAPLATIATFLFCAIYALCYAAAGYACAWPRIAPALRVGVLAPVAWTLAEWTRSWLFTGFPWLATGYSQIPESPLAGYAPALGIYGVTLAVALTAGLIAILGLRLMDKSEDRRMKDDLVRLLPSAFTLLAIWLGGWGLSQIAWTTPVGAPVNVSLLQGNVEQDLKWRAERVRPTLETYRLLAESAPGELIIMPETALPLFLEQVPPDYLAALTEIARKKGGDILIGVPERAPSGEYYNSVVSIGTSPQQVYRKSHLVPFGEFIPLRPVLAWIVGVLAIPLQDFARGAPDQRPLAVAGQRVAINICYEDVFGEEIIRQLPEATVLANVSNVAWFGRSLAPRQHLQIAQARAIESGRSMLRATNTGLTAVIGPRGNVLAAAPEFEIATVTHAVQGYGGATPYVRWGNYAVLGLCVALIAVVAWIARRSARSAA